MQPHLLQAHRPARPHVLRCSLAPRTLRRAAPAFKAAHSSRRLSQPPAQHQGGPQGRQRGHPVLQASNGAGPEPEAGPAGQPPPDVEALWDDALKQFREKFGVGDLEDELEAAGGPLVPRRFLCLSSFCIPSAYQTSRLVGSCLVESGPLAG